MNARFNLETAIAAWRRAYEHSRAFLADDLEELERHLRDHVAALVHRGWAAEDAFREALRGVGDFGSTETEYRKVYWTKTRHRHAFLRETLNEVRMLSNYFKIAFRNLRKQPGYSLINIGGLGLGLACAFMIVLYVQHERSFDRFHENGDRIYRVIRKAVRGEDAGQKSALSAAGLAPELAARFPEIEALVRYEDRTPYLRVGSESIQADDFAFMDNTALEVFTFPLLRGDPATVLDAPYSLVLTEAAARALFGAADPMGQTVSFNERFDLTVTGILADVPRNSHLRFSYLAPFELMKELMGPDALENFTNWNYHTYALLRPGVDPVQLEARMQAYNQERFGDGDGPPTSAFVLQPLTSIHFTTDVGWDVGTNVDPKYVYMFSGIALLILLIACVNFMNLATARAAQRAKEVGVRKVMGAQRRQLVTQFLGESVLLSVLAIGLGLACTFAFLPTFRTIIGSDVAVDPASMGTLVLLVGIGLAAGVVAGSYPAFYLSAFRAAHVLKGEATRSSRAAVLRKTLIVFQFAISIFLIVGTITIYKQLHYMKGRALGFEKEHVVFAPMVGDIGERYETFRERLLQDPRVLSVARASGLPGRVGTTRGYNWPGAAGAADQQSEQGRSFRTIIADVGYVETLGLELVAGRAFAEDVAGDTMDAYVLNEAAVKALGWSPDEAVGHPFRAWDRPMGQVIGVVKDFHFASLHQQIEPVVLNVIPAWQWAAVVRLAPGDVSGALDALEAHWRAFAPGYPFDYRFLDQDFDRLYREEEDLGRLFTFFALLAIFVACLGLFGLASFSAQQRTKEIGVRKVMGASVPQIVVLLSKEFTRLVVIGFVIAAPLAFYAMSQWLEQFAYRTSPGVGTFVLAAALAFAIALVTVSYQSIRAATANPVKALRYE